MRLAAAMGIPYSEQIWLAAEDGRCGGDQGCVIGREGAIPEVFTVFQADAGRPSSLSCELDEGPERRVEAVEKNRAVHIRTLKHCRDAFRDLVRNLEILLFDFDQ